MVDIVILKPLLNEESFSNTPVTIDADGKLWTFIVSCYIVVEVLRQFFINCQNMWFFSRRKVVFRCVCEVTIWREESM